jgi:hypothetical protein
MIRHSQEDVIDSLKLVQDISLEAALQGDFINVAGLEVVKNCLVELGCRIQHEERVERLNRCFKL